MRSDSIDSISVFVTMTLFLGLFVASIGGWIANIVKLAGLIDDPITGMFVLRVVGIFVAPLGSILGYI